MDNYFLQNPIKINILGINENNIYINYKIIFLGNVPENIKNNIIKFDINKSKKILKEYYGLNWNKKLELIEEKKGGNDYIQEQESFTSEDLINFDDFNLDILNPELNNIEEISKEIEYKEVSKDKIKIIYNTDISIYPNDNIKILKEKIFLSTNIQIYEQNISFYYYNLYIDDLKYNITLNNDIFKLPTIHNIPIDKYLYKNKNNINISGLTVNSNISIKTGEFEYLYSYFKENNKLEINVLSLKEFITNKSELEKIINNDIQQTEMIYYSFIIKYYPIISLELFKDYIINENDIKFKYTNLYLNIDKTLEKYKLENDIYIKNNIIDKNYNTFIKNEFILAIVERSYLVLSLNKLNKIYIRNLFDSIELSKISNINYIYINININDNDVILSKINTLITKNYKNNHIIDLNSMLINIKVINKKLNIKEIDNIYINLIINETGGYSVFISLPKNIQLNYNQIDELVIETINPILIKINKKLYSSDSNIQLLTKYNYIVNHNITNLFWKQELTIKSYNILKLLLKDYIKSGILSLKSEHFTNNEIEYKINKGINNFNDKLMDNYNNFNTNYFSYYTNPDINIQWERVYLNNKTIVLKNRINDIKFEFNRLTLNEFEFISKFIYKLLYINKHRILNQDDVKKINVLKYLKQSDPLLYNIKDSKTGKDIYSRKCQKKLQPIIVPKTFINDDNKKKVIKYWNFSKNKDEYYYCPNNNYPFVKFLTNIHPNGYCVPCCKKKDIDDLDVDNKSKLLYNTCLNNHIYDPSSIKLDKSRYIMTYGKDLEFDRIMSLPNELEIILNNDIKKNIEKYYLLGKKQNNIGIIHILSDVYDMSSDNYIKYIIKYLKDFPNIFNKLLNGILIYYFNNLNDLLITMSNIFIYNKIIYKNSFTKWNKLFIDISKYMNINIIIFKDHNEISIDIPKNTKYISDIIIPNKLINYLVIIKKTLSTNENIYFPIFLINPKKHYKIHEIKQKLYKYDDDIILNIKKIYNNYITDTKYNIFDLNILSQFINESKYNIINYYISNNNKCYAVLIKYLSEYVYIPIQESIYDENTDNIKQKLYFNIFDKNKYILKLNSIIQFITEYNNFIYHFLVKENIINKELSQIYLYDIKLYNKSSEINTKSFNFDIISNFKYSFIRIDKFLKLDNNIIGLICNNMYFYINPNMKINLIDNIITTNIKYIKNIINKKLELKLLLTRTFTLEHDTYIKEILYDPIYINNIIMNDTKEISDNRIHNINTSLYNIYLYQLIIIEYQKEFSVYLNKSFRNKLKHIINNLNSNELSTHYFKTNNNKIYTLISKNKDIYLDNIDNIYDDIINIILFYINNKNFNSTKIKKEIIQNIDNNKFQFDKLYLNKFKLMKINDLVNELQSISKSLFTIVSESELQKILHKKFIFPNILLSCKDHNHNHYCKSSKLVLTKNDLDIYLEILANDIHNPIKINYIFTSFFIDNNINYYQFEQYINEKIFIN